MTRRTFGRRSLFATIAGIAVLSGAAGFRSARAKHVVDRSAIAREYVTAASYRLDSALDDIAAALTAGYRERAIVAFHAARTQYKRLEPIVELYSPALGVAFNARRQEIDDDDQPPPSALGATGFPALEQALWPANRAATPASAAMLVMEMHETTKRTRSLAASLTVTEPQLVEAARLEIVRLSTLGIAGFDAPASGAALAETADALDGVRDLVFAAGSTRWQGHANELAVLGRSLARASAGLRANSNFETADRLTILVDYLQPVAHALDSLRRAAQIVPLTMPRPLRALAASPYDAGAFDVFAYAPSGAAVRSAPMSELGARLFAERALSGPRTRSCASCHVPSMAFSDGLATPASITTPGRRAARNTPTLLNAALQPSQFADERVGPLEQQVAEVLRSDVEMASSDEIAAGRIANDSLYRVAFAKAFGVDPAHAVTPLRLRQALAAYVRDLTRLNSRFDRAVRGDTAALSATERRGFTLFMGKARCGTCHFAPLFSGNTPPLYRSSDVEVIGVPARADRPRDVDPDSGRARVDHLPIHLRAFKTPSLRNVARTAPYMHNGAFRTLDDVMDFYERGGGAGAGALLDNQTLPADSLHLAPDERRAIVAFLRALTDTI